jgi:glycerophosphoryl diester phosphodiesterase
MAHAIAHFRRRPGERPLVLGHRGARRDAPENTLDAFELAREQGADGVELDVRFDGDGRVVVLHDPDLKRVTRERDARSVEALTSRELDRVDLGGGARVPELSAVLAWAAPHSLLVNVELKHDVRRRRDLVRRVARLVRQAPDAAERVILSCFHPGIVLALSRRLPEFAVAWLVHAGQRFARGARGFRLLGARAVHPEHVLATPARVRRWQRGGAVVNAWTVNDAAEARRLAALGVDGLISDAPREILAAFAVAPRRTDNPT